MKKIRLLCAEDHLMVREGLTVILNMQPDMEVVAAASTAEEAVQAYRQQAPDVTLMDLELGVMGGVEAIRQIIASDPEARIIVLTMYQGSEDIHRALKAGAVTYLFKDMISDELIATIRDIAHRGESPLPDPVETRLAERDSHQPLSPRELQVLELISRGMRNKEIAAALSVSEETVEVHIRNLFAKLGVKDRTAAVSVSVKHGIIHL